MTQQSLSKQGRLTGATRKAEHEWSNAEPSWEINLYVRIGGTPLASSLYQEGSIFRMMRSFVILGLTDATAGAPSPAPAHPLKSSILPK
jgi:hypothetical protein